MTLELINTINSLPIEEVFEVQKMINDKISKHQVNTEIDCIKKELIIKLRLKKVYQT